MPEALSTHGRRSLVCARLILLLFALVAVLSLSKSASASTPDPIDIPIPPSAPGIPIDDFDIPDVPDGLPSDRTGGPINDPFGDDPFGDEAESENSATIGLELPDVTGDSSNAVVIILLLSVLSIAPSLLILTTSFTRIVIVMSLTRNALGIPQLPPQQVIVGLSVFLSLFVMGPTLETMNELALQPLMNGELSFTEAADAATGPLREFMLQSTREAELEMFLDVSDTATPVVRDEVSLTALIPAFVLSELKSAFIMGFVIFVPFMVIDIVVSAVLTSLGMMMLPPTFVSLPLKLLLFILLDGWTLIVGTLLASYQ